MTNFARMFALGASLACGACGAMAQTVISTMTCSSGGAVVLTLPVYSIFEDLPNALPAYVTVTAPAAQFNTLAEAHFFYPSLDSCKFSPSNGTYFASITIADVSGHADATQQYSSLTLSYTVIGIGPETSVAVAKPATALTAGELRTALADHLARVPKPPVSGTAATTK